MAAYDLNSALLQALVGAPGGAVGIPMGANTLPGGSNTYYNLSAPVPIPPPRPVGIPLGPNSTGPQQPMVVQRTAPGKTKRAPISTTGREFQPGVGADATPMPDLSMIPMEGGTAPGALPADYGKPIPKVRTGADSPAPTVGPAGGSPPPNVGMTPSMVPDPNAPLPDMPAPGSLDTDTSGSTAAPADTTPTPQPSQTPGLLESLGLGGAAPYLRAFGAGAQNIGSNPNPFIAFGQGFGGAQGYYTKEEDQAKKDAIEAAQRAQTQKNWQSEFGLKSDEAKQRAAATQQEMGIRGAAEGRAATTFQEEQDYKKSPDYAYDQAYTKAKERAKDVPQPKRADFMGDEAGYQTALQQWQDSVDKIGSEERANKGLFHGTGGADDPYALSDDKWNARHPMEVQEYANQAAARQAQGRDTFLKVGKTLLKWSQDPTTGVYSWNQVGEAPKQAAAGAAGSTAAPAGAAPAAGLGGPDLAAARSSGPPPNLSPQDFIHRVFGG